MQARFKQCNRRKRDIALTITKLYRTENLKAEPKVRNLEQY